MTNKSLFVTIFIISIIGLLGGINILYQHLNSAPDTQEYSVNQLNQKLVAAESQIKMVVSENNSLRVEVKGLKYMINDLSSKINGLGSLQEPRARTKLKDNGVHIVENEDKTSSVHNINKA